MLLYSLLKTQHFAIPLSVTVSKAKNFSSPFRNDHQTWEVKGKKRTSEYRRKMGLMGLMGLMDLKLQKNWDEWKFFVLKFFSRAIEITTQFCASSNIAFLQEKIQPLRRSLPNV